MSDEAEYGPAMLALTEKQRAFVLALLTIPGCSHRRAAIEAGYSDVADAAKVRGHECAHNPNVQAALREEAGKRLNSMTVLAANVLMDLMLAEDTAPKDKLKAATAVLDRTGFAASQTINVNKNVTDNSGKALLERIKRAADALGVDPGALLGTAPMKVINHE